MAQNIPRKEHFQQAYDGKAPWDIGKPQPVFVNAAEQITGSVFDVGCGTGENALFFSQRGHEVTGIDFLEHPITEAKRRAKGRGLPATFLVMDALHLEDIPEVFDSVIDCGLYGGSFDQEVTDVNIGIHHARFGKVLKEKMDALDIRCIVNAGGQVLGDGGNVSPIDFMKQEFGMME